MRCGECMAAELSVRAFLALMLLGIPVRRGSLIARASLC